MSNIDKDVNAASNAVWIEVDAGVRYWEDASVDGEPEDDENPRIFGAKGDRWKVKIRLSNGQIDGWPQGMTASVHYKVCDDGVYRLLDDAGEVLAERDWYVPGEFLCHGDEGYGDYIIFGVGADGKIENYRQPQDYSFFTGKDD